MGDAPVLVVRWPGGSMMTMPLRVGEDGFSTAARLFEAGDEARMRQAEWCVVRVGHARLAGWPSPEPWVPVAPPRVG